MSVHHIVLLTTIFATVSSSNDCHACFDGVCYSKTPILENYSFSGQLAVDRTENSVYFHYKDDRSIDYTAAFDLDDIRLRIVPDIDFSFARAVDQTTRDVYMGGTKGVYKYNPISNRTTQYGLPDKTIVHMQFKNKLYFTVLDTKGVFTLDNRKPKLISALSDYTIDDFVVDYGNDLYFLSKTNVYCLKKGAKMATVIADEVYSLSIDKNEVVHFVQSGKKGLYKIDTKTGELYEVGAFGSGLPLKYVFDNNNNMIYHENNSKKLFYLMPNYGRCVVSQKSQGRFKKPLKTFGQTSAENNEEPELVIERIS